MDSGKPSDAPQVAGAVVQERLEHLSQVVPPPQAAAQLEEGVGQPGIGGFLTEGPAVVIPGFTRTILSA